MSRARSDWALLPNQLTLTRFLAAALIPVVFLAWERPTADLAALGLFVYASLTDFADGWIARRFNQTSALGATLDPLADKALLLATLAALAATTFAGAVWFLLGSALIAAREVGVSLLRRWRPNARALVVRRDAKWKTAAQMTAASTLLAAGAAEASATDAVASTLTAIGVVLFAIAVVLSVSTGVAYLRGALAEGRGSDGARPL